MALYVEKPTIVEAVQYFEDSPEEAIALVQSVHGPAAEHGFLKYVLHAVDSDFAVKHPGQRVEIVKSDEFERRYEQQ